jgi:hypothetical protein
VRRFLFLPVVVLVSALAVTTAQARVQGIRITSLPRHVTQGSLEHLNATVSRGPAKCSLTIRYASSKRKALGSKAVLAHRIAWTWRVPRAAEVGKASARVSCKGLAAKTRTFIVKRRLTPASVTVVKSGLTQVPDGYDNGTTISYGLVLVNHSQDEDARDVEVDVNLLDAAGNAVASETKYISGGIPAGDTYYVGDQVFTNDATTVSRLAAFLKVAESKPRSLLAPPVTNLRLSADQLDGSVVVDGDVTNEGTQQLSGLAQIDAVFFNSAGNVVGGGYTYPPFALPPGAQTAFEIDTWPNGPQASHVSEVKVSVEPNYGSF